MRESCMSGAPFDLRVGCCRPEICVAHRMKRELAGGFQLRSQSRAQTCTIVTGRRLHKNPVHRSGGKNSSVGLGIQCDSASEAQITRSGLGSAAARASESMATSQESCTAKARFL